MTIDKQKKYRSKRQSTNHKRRGKEIKKSVAEKMQSIK
jgi:hypothetical protein